MTSRKDEAWKGGSSSRAPHCGSLHYSVANTRASETLGQRGLVLWASEKSSFGTWTPGQGRGNCQVFPPLPATAGQLGDVAQGLHAPVLAEQCPSRSPLEDDPSYSLFLFLQYEHGRGCQSHADSWKAKRRRFESFFQVYGQLPHTFPHPCKALVAFSDDFQLFFLCLLFR